MEVKSETKQQPDAAGQSEASALYDNMGLGTKSIFGYQIRDKNILIG